MARRYRWARAMGVERYREVLKEDTDLLARYGLRLMSVDCGITAAVEEELRGDAIHPWNIVEMNDKTWGWLRPLLVRLKEAEEAIDRVEAADAPKMAAK